MKKLNSNRLVFSALAVLTLIISSCTKDLLDRTPTGEMSATEFWKTEGDATVALMGAYSAVRPLFDRDYYFDGQGVREGTWYKYNQG